MSRFLLPIVRKETRYPAGGFISGDDLGSGGFEEANVAYGSRSLDRIYPVSLCKIDCRVFIFGFPCPEELKWLGHLLRPMVEHPHLWTVGVNGT